MHQTHKIKELNDQIKILNNELAYYKNNTNMLKKCHSFLKAIIQRSAEGICVCHAIPDYPYIKFTVWNNRMTELTGYTIKEINIKGWYQSMYPDPMLQQKAIKRMERMREGKDLFGERWEVVRSDGQKRIFSISTSLLPSDNDRDNVLGLMLDVTRKEQEINELRKILKDTLQALSFCQPSMDIKRIL